MATARFVLPGQQRQNPLAFNYGLSQTGAAVSSWRDSELETIERYNIEHDEAKTDRLLWKWYTQATKENAKPASGFVQLTAWVACQLLSPSSKAFLFPEDSDSSGLTNEKYQGRKESSEDMLLKFVSEDQFPDPERIPTPVEQKAARCVVPALALFSLKAAFGRTVMLCEKSSKADAFFSNIYGVATSAEKLSFKLSYAALNAIKNSCVVGTAIMNTVLVAALKVYREVQPKSEKPNTLIGKLLEYCILDHAKWYGLAVIGKLEQVARVYQKPMGYFVQEVENKATRKECAAVKHYLDLFVRPGSGTILHPWSRALSSKYHMNLSNRSVATLICVWAWFLDPQGDGGIWETPFLKKLPERIIYSAKQTARPIIALLQDAGDFNGAKGTESDDDENCFL